MLEIQVGQSGFAGEQAGLPTGNFPLFLQEDLLLFAP